VISSTNSKVPKPRIKHLEQIYSNIYYNSKIQSEVKKQEAIKAEKAQAGLPRKQPVIICSEVTIHLFKEESAEVKVEVASECE
jgi:ribosomal protein L9